MQFRSCGVKMCKHFSYCTHQHTSKIQAPPVHTKPTTRKKKSFALG